MDADATNQSKLQSDEASKTDERCCRQKSGENRAPNQPEKSHIFVQYDEGNRSAYADFGATLLTDSQSHRLVEVSPSGIAHRIGLRFNDEIFFFNGVDVGDVIHGSFVDAIKDVGPKIMFGVIRTAQQEKGSPLEKGYVYVRLGADANNMPQITSHKMELTEVEHKEEFVELIVLDDGEGFSAANTYKLMGSQEMQLSTDQGMYLAISSAGASFVRRNFALCKYTYQPATSPGGATIIAIATVVSDPTSPQYCISGDTAGPLSTEVFPDYMKTIRRPPKFLVTTQTDGKLFRWVVDRRGKETITPQTNSDLMLDSGTSPEYKACLQAETFYVTINDQDDCTAICTISQTTAPDECSDD